MTDPRRDDAPRTDGAGAKARGERSLPEAGPRRAGAAYQGALEAVFAILISMGIGYWADQHFDTAPRFLILGVIVGFGSFVLRLSRMRRLLEEPPEGPPKPPEAR